MAGSICPIVKSQYERLQELMRDFEQETQQVKMTGDLENIRKKRDEISQLRDKLWWWNEVALSKRFDKHFFQIQETTKVFGPLSREQQHRYFHVPFKTETLEACKENYVLYYDTGISIMEMVKMYPFFFHVDMDWLSHQPFATKQGVPGWMLNGKELHRYAGVKTFDEQQDSIDTSGCHVTTARDEIYIGLLSLLAKNRHRLGVYTLRTSDRNPAFTGNHICVAPYLSDQIQIYSRSDTEQNWTLSMNQKRKPDRPKTA